MTTTPQQPAMPAEACDSPLPSASGVGCMDLLERPVRDSGITVWSNGGGVQSGCMAALIDAGELPKPDIAAIVDTGKEKGTTWQYYDAVVKPAMEKLGIQCVRIPSAKWATVGIYAKNGDLLLPAFTRQSGELSKLPTFCSTEWKWRVLKRWLRAQGVKQCNVWMGMSWDELDRMKDSDVDWITKEYPLITMKRMRRWECEPYVIAHGWPKPPRSACYICPNQQPEEWQTNSGPEQLAAIKLDSALRAHDPNVYLHRSGKPLGEALNEKPDDTQKELFGTCDGGHCFV